MSADEKFEVMCAFVFFAEIVLVVFLAMFM